MPCRGYAIPACIAGGIPACLAVGVCYPSMPCSMGVPGLGGSASKGVPGPGGLLRRDLVETVTAAGGTHPTRLHSCSSNFSRNFIPKHSH